MDHRAREEKSVCDISGGKKNPHLDPLSIKTWAVLLYRCFQMISDIWNCLFLKKKKNRFWEFSYPCSWWRLVIVNGLFHFFFSPVFSKCVSDVACAAASLHPFSPHGGRVVLTKTICSAGVHQQSSSFTANFSQKHFHIPSLPRARGCEGKKAAMESRNVRLEKWAGAASGGTFAGSFFNLLTCERRRWRRRKMLRGWGSLWGSGRRRRCMAATGYWKRHWVDNLSCYQTCWGEVGEWGSAHSSSHLSSDFSIALFLSLHTSLANTMMKSLFWLASFCLITFNEWQMIYHSNGSH